MIRPSDVSRRYSTIPLILLGLSLLTGLHRADPGKSGRTGATPPLKGVSCGPDSGPVFHAATVPSRGSLPSLFIPAGRLGKDPQTRR